MERVTRRRGPLRARTLDVLHVDGEYLMRLQKRLDHPRVPTPCGEVERRHACDVEEVDIGSVCDELFDDIGVCGADGEMEGVASGSIDSPVNPRLTHRDAPVGPHRQRPAECYEVIGDDGVAHLVALESGEGAAAERSGEREALGKEGVTLLALRPTSLAAL